MSNGLDSVKNDVYLGEVEDCINVVEGKPVIEVVEELIRVLALYRSYDPVSKRSLPGQLLTRVGSVL